MTAAMDITPALRAFDLQLTEGALVARTPIDGSITARLAAHDAVGVSSAIGRAREAFLAWRDVPAPLRGELVRRFGDELRAAKEALAALVTIEAGKIAAEARGEVQEMIDICDFACGLSRQLHGLTIASERPGHRMSETWHPLGVVGVISAFNFPVAVWAWNFALAIACGDSVVWKPSDKTPLTALACQALFQRAAARFGQAPAGLSEVLIGGSDNLLHICWSGPILGHPGPLWRRCFPRRSARSCPAGGPVLQPRRVPLRGRHPLTHGKKSRIPTGRCWSSSPPLQIVPSRCLSRCYPYSFTRCCARCGRGVSHRPGGGITA